MSRANDVSERMPRRWLRWLVIALAAALAAGGAAALALWVAGGSSTSSGPSLLTPPRALPAAHSARPVLSLARRASDVLIGLRVPRGGPVELTVIPSDMKPVPISALAVSVGEHERASLTACGNTCFRAAAPGALRRPLQVGVVVTRKGEQPARAVFTLPPRLPPAADGVLRVINARMSRVRSFRLDETLSSGRTGITARFLFQAPNRMTYATSDASRAVIIGSKRWDSDGGGPWKESETPGVRVPSYIWAGAGSARVLGRSTLDGQPVTVLGAFRPDAVFPAWFRLFVRPNQLVVRAEMVAPAHFMADRLTRFDRPVTIEPPRAGARPTVWDQMRPVGRGPRYQPAAGGPAVAAARPVGELRCRPRTDARVGAHLELFANQRVLIIPAGVGVAPPHQRDGAYVRGGRCSYAARTTEPTGVIEVVAGTPVTLGQFFDLWGQRLSPTRLAAFTARPGSRVLAFVAGRPWRGDPGSIQLRRHAQVVLEVNGYVPPHSRYRFPPGL